MNKLRKVNKRLKELYNTTKILKVEFEQFDFHKSTKIIKLVFKVNSTELFRSFIT